MTKNNYHTIISVFIFSMSMLNGMDQKISYGSVVNKDSFWQKIEKTRDLPIIYNMMNAFRIKDQHFFINDNGTTLFHIVAKIAFRDKTFNVRETIFKDLVNLAVNINAQDDRKKTALHYACSNEDFRTALLLVKYGARPDAQDNEGNNVFHLLSMPIYKKEPKQYHAKLLSLIFSDHVIKDIDVKKLLFQENNEGWAPVELILNAYYNQKKGHTSSCFEIFNLYKKKYFGDLSTLEFICKLRDEQEKKQDDNSAKQRHADVVEIDEDMVEDFLFLSRKRVENIDESFFRFPHVEEDKQTMLFQACQTRDFNLIKNLICAGMDPLQKNSEGKTCLDILVGYKDSLNDNEKDIFQELSTELYKRYPGSVLYLT